MQSRRKENEKTPLGRRRRNGKSEKEAVPCKGMHNLEYRE